MPTTRLSHARRASRKFHAREQLGDWSRRPSPRPPRRDRVRRACPPRFSLRRCESALPIRRKCRRIFVLTETFNSVLASGLIFPFLQFFHQPPILLAMSDKIKLALGMAGVGDP